MASGGSGVAASASAATPDGLNIKARQTGVLNRLLSLQSRDDSLALSTASVDSDVASSWKVLIYDRYCQDLLSPLLTVNQLRSLGITLHMSLHATRERVPDVPAVYFVRATEENVGIIARDVRAGIYDSTYINFSGRCPSALLESLASQILREPAAGQAKHAPSVGGGGVLQSGAAAAARIVRIMDQYCEFISLEDRLFTLNLSESFARLNGGSDEVMLRHVDEVVDALFGVLVTAGVVPIIRARVGHAAELVASRLDARLREHLSSRNNLFASSAGGGGALGFQRPLLVLSDRNMDLCAPLLHSWTYQSLLADLLGMASNRVTVAVSDASAAPGAQPKPRTYDLLSSEDKFWKHHAGRPFPQVAEGVTERLQAYQTEYNALTRKSGGGGGADLTSGNDDLASAISALPKLQKRKKLLDTHMNIATALLKEIKSREIDVFFDIEQSLLQKQSIDKNAVPSIFGTGAAAADGSGDNKPKGTPMDRLRFLLIFYLQAGATEEQLNAYRATLQQAHAAATADPSAAGSSNGALAQDISHELAAIDYVVQFKMLHRLTSGDGMGAAPQSAAPKAASSGASSMLGNLSKLTNSVLEGGVGLLSGVRNLLPVSNHLPLTRAVEQLALNREGNDALEREWKTFDPKSRGGARVTRPSGAFRDVLVFQLGGGCYAEYQNLQDWSKDGGANSGVHSVVYGCSELVAPEAFVRQLAGMQHAAQQAKRANIPVD